jgi:hypothetical protein
VFALTLTRSGPPRSSGCNQLTAHFGDIKNGTREEVHDVGELWAATLWDVRNGLDRVGGLGARSLSNSSCPA